VVVSEETGALSVAYEGQLVSRLDLARLRTALLGFYQHQLTGRSWTEAI
jgi:hypothetical protein